MTDSPLADKIRPKKLSEFIGQEGLVGEGGVLRKLIESDEIPSMIFWGPPGSGKTTLAQIIANATHAEFFFLSAVAVGKKEIAEVIQKATAYRRSFDRPSILFLDEIHRFNKAQQDFLLPFVEKGIITFIGATTENPSFEVIGPLLSRCRVFVLNRLEEKDLEKIARRGLKALRVKINPKALTFLVQFANGDARIVLTALEIASSINKGRQISLQLIKAVLQKENLIYDRLGEEHYNTISAFIKSMRASNPDAALYYLARMVEAGEDPLFIARRMVIFASEDIGMAQPTALVVANEVFRACDTIGYPECAINLAHGVVYLAKAKKDRSAYDAYFRAVDDVKKYGNLPTPLKIRNPVTKLMKGLGYGEGYYETKYKLTNIDLLPKKLKGKKYYEG
jgi:putative ATPase